jgi:phospholipid/cholesterol/gamma-HCH transport system substrate-binding protein
VALSPGGSEEAFKNGDQVEFVQDAVVLENLISKYLFDSAAKKSEAAAAPAPAPAAQE